MVAGAYLAFLVLAPLVTLRATPQRAIWLVYCGGLLLLPPMVYSGTVGSETFDWRIIGNALPSDRLPNSAMVAAFAALLTAVLRDGGALARWRPSWLDLPMALFCFWPLAQDLLVAGPSHPAGAISAIVMLAVWGVPWMLARIYLSNAAGRVAFAGALTWVMVLLVPFAMLETVLDWRLHEALIGPHPFAFDGNHRYFGFRPLLMLENGNQYGLYICLAALFALARALGQARGWRRPEPMAIALVLTLLALASQSVGAIVLTIVAGLTATVLWRERWAGLAVATGGIAAAVLAAYSAGLIPAREIAEATGLAEPIKAALNSVGRHSLAWRVSQNDQTADLLREAWLFGHGTWDWFTPSETRPWGFWSLLVGQFGIVAALSLAAVAALAFAQETLAPQAHVGRAERATSDVPLAIFRAAIVVALLDAVLNSFIFYPVSAMMAACLAGRTGSRALRATEGDQ